MLFIGFTRGLGAEVTHDGHALFLRLHPDLPDAVLVTGSGVFAAAGRPVDRLTLEIGGNGARLERRGDRLDVRAFKCRKGVRVIFDGPHSFSVRRRRVG
jgi:uncharacterized protein YebE (UPF0316 family)